MSDVTSSGIGIFLPPSVPAFLLCTSFIAWIGWALSAGSPLWRDRALALPVWMSAFLVAATQALSLARELHWPGLLALCAAGAIGVWWRSRRLPLTTGRNEAGDGRSAVPAREWFLLAVCALPAVAYGLWSSWLMLASSEPLGDNVTYHLPRLGYWLAHQSVAPFLANDPRTGSFAPNGNILQLFPVLFLRTDRLSAFSQLGSLFATCLAIFAAARDLGAGRVAGGLAAFTWFAIPAVLQQATTSNVDLIATFFAMTTATLALASVRRPAVGNAWACLAAAALAVGTKPQTLAVALPGALVAIAVLWRHERPRTVRMVPLAALGIWLVAVLPFAQNATRFGSPTGVPAVAWVVSDPGLPTLARNLQLVLSPLDPRSPLAVRYGRAEAWSVKQAFTGPGLGLMWLGLAVVSALYLARCAVRRRPGLVTLAYASSALGFAASVLFVFRHQPSIVRFLLPGAAMLTPLLAPALTAALGSGLPRAAIVSLAVVVPGSYVLSDWAEADVMARRRPVPRFELKPPAEMAGPDLVLLARTIEERSLTRGPGMRLGTITPQTYRERILFGPRYTNVLVPLSYASRLDRQTLDRLRLDALFMDTNGTFILEMFDHPLTKVPMRHSERWRLTEVAGFDQDFLRGYREVSSLRSFEDVAVRLGQPGSGWALDFSGSGALLFVPRRTVEAALGAFTFIDSGGRVLPDGESIDVDSRRQAAVMIFAARPGPARLRAKVSPGPTLVAGRARLDVGGTPGGQSFEVGAGRWELPLQLKAGLNVVAFRVGGRSHPPGAAEPGAATLQLQRVRVQWAE